MSQDPQVRQLQKIDPKQLQNLMRNPDFIRTQSPEMIAKYNYRVMTAGWSPDERLVYDAVQDGYTSMDSLPVATGLDSASISAAYNSLVNRGLVAPMVKEVSLDYLG